VEVLCRQVVQTVNNRAVDRDDWIFSDGVFGTSVLCDEIALVGQMARRAAMTAGRITQVVRVKRRLGTEASGFLALSWPCGIQGDCSGTTARDVLLVGFPLVQLCDDTFENVAQVFCSSKFNLCGHKREAKVFRRKCFGNSNATAELSTGNNQQLKKNKNVTERQCQYKIRIEVTKCFFWNSNATCELSTGNDQQLKKSKNATINSSNPQIETEGNRISRTANVNKAYEDELPG
jgi:hypothetical protein